MIRTLGLTLTLLMAGLFLSGCAQTSVIGVEPISPKAGMQTPVVESLTPTLSWHPVTDVPCTYDLVIYEGVKLPSGEVLPGKEVYYREALVESTHQVTPTLRPGFIYLWSLRVRRDGEPRAWSKWNYSDGNYGQVNCWFAFQAPGKT